MAKEWVNDAQNEARVEAKLCAKANKALGAFDKKNKELVNKLMEEEKAHLSAEASLKTVEKHVEDQCKKLHIIKIELATQR